MTNKERELLIAASRGIISLLYSLSGGVEDQKAARGLRATGDRIDMAIDGLEAELRASESKA